MVTVGARTRTESPDCLPLGETRAGGFVFGRELTRARDLATAGGPPEEWFLPTSRAGAG
jgi:hypothetical protein